MSSWRNLLTPLQEKTLSRNPDYASSTSSLSHTASSNQLWDKSKITSPANLNSKECSLLKVSCNDKIKMLKSEMGKLKEQLHKYSMKPNVESKIDEGHSDASNEEMSKDSPGSQKSRHVKARSEHVMKKKNDQSEIDSFYKTNPKKLTQEPISSINKRSVAAYSKNRRSPSSPCLEESSEEKRKERKEDLSSDEDPVQEEDRESSREYFKKFGSQGSRHESELHSDSKEKESKQLDALDTNGDLRSYVLKLSSELQNEKLKSERMNNKLLHSLQEKHSLKQSLEECRSEIQELKEMILNSKKSSMVVSRNDRQSQQSYNNTQKEKGLRQLSVISRSDKENIDLNIQSTDSSTPTNLNRTNESRNSKRPPTRSETLDSDSMSGFLKKKCPTSTHLRQKSFETGHLVDENTAKNSKAQTRRSGSNSSTGEINSSKLGAMESNFETKDKVKSARSQGCQCDLALETLAIEHENELDARIKLLEDQIKIKELENAKLKTDRNMMISTFQELIRYLTDNKDEAIAKEKRETISQIKRFSESFLGKISELKAYSEQSLCYHSKSKSMLVGDQERLSVERERVEHFDRSLPCSTNKKSNQTMTSGHNRELRGLKTDLSDNFNYSPSVNDHTSFSENLLESKGYRPNGDNDSPLLIEKVFRDYQPSSFK